jgi:hypothetical protein
MKTSKKHRKQVLEAIKEARKEDETGIKSKLFKDVTITVTKDKNGKTIGVNWKY